MKQPLIPPTTDVERIIQQRKEFLAQACKIEKGIPIPEKAPKTNIYQLERLEVGDSIHLPLIFGERPKKKFSRLAQAVFTFRKKHPERMFTVRHVVTSECVRCWRIK